jgi:hypothetical protein
VPRRDAWVARLGRHVHRRDVSVARLDRGLARAALGYGTDTSAQSPIARPGSGGTSGSSTSPSNTSGVPGSVSSGGAGAPSSLSAGCSFTALESGHDTKMPAFLMLSALLGVVFVRARGRQQGRATLAELDCASCHPPPASSRHEHDGRKPCEHSVQRAGPLRRGR